MRHIHFFIIALLVVLLVPNFSFAAIDISIDGQAVPLPDLTPEQITSGADTAVELWTSFNNLSVRVNEWLENTAGIKLVALLKAIGAFFVMLAKWMIAIIEFFLSRA